MIQGRSKRLLRAFAVVLLIFSSLMLLMSVLGEGIGPAHFYASFCDGFSHLRIQILLLQCLSFFIFWVIFDKRCLLLALLIIMFNLKDMIPYYNPFIVKAFSTQLRPLRIVQWNIYQQNSGLKFFRKFVSQKDPDLIALQEFSKEHLEILNKALVRYPYRVLIPEENCFGLALYSKYPITEPKVHYFGFDIPEQLYVSASLLAKSNLKQSTKVFLDPSISVVLHHPKQLISVIVTHPVPPFGGLYGGFEVRNKQLQDLASFVKRQSYPVIVMGDMNSSPWSVYFQTFLKETQLQDSQLGHGIQPSWPNFISGPAFPALHHHIPSFLIPFLQSPIDHVLVSPTLNILKRELGPASTGSDHLPVYVELEPNVVAHHP